MSEYSPRQEQVGRYIFKADTEPQTTILRRLGQPFTDWYENVRKPYLKSGVKHKKLAVGGIVGVSKSEFIRALIDHENHDSELQEHYKHIGGSPRRLILNGADMAEYGMNAGFITPKDPPFKAKAYNALSVNAAAAIAYGEIVSSDEDTSLYVEGGFTTCIRTKDGKIRGVDRALSVAIYVFENMGEIVLIAAEDSFSMRNMTMRSEILLAPFDQVHRILWEKYHTKDNRTPEQIKADMGRNGNQKTFTSQRRLQNKLMHSMSGRDGLGKPSIPFEYPSTLDYHPQEKLKYIAETFYPYWGKSLARERNLPPSIAVFVNDDTELRDDNEWFGGRADKLEEYKLANYLNEKTAGSTRWRERDTLKYLGVIP